MPADVESEPADGGTMDLLLWAWGGAAVLMVVLWGVQLRTRDAGIVDVGWAGGLGAAAIVHALLADGDPERRVLVGVLGALWGWRLALHLLRDRVVGRHEDGRYATLRAAWAASAGGAAPRFFVLFQAQALLVGLLSLAFLLPAQAARPGLDALDLLGAAIWVLAIAGETLADRQLRAFRRDPGNRGRTCRSGLWRYSRHPNYFFEWVHWLAYLPLTWGAPGAWAAALPPVLMLVFILKITGIPPTEAQALKSRGDDYRAYQRTTSAFVPWPPNESAA